MTFKTNSIFSFILLLCSTTCFGQDHPIGTWRSHMSYNNSNGLCTDGTTLYTITKQAFFTLDAKKGDGVAYSKVNGMSDIGMQKVAYDDATRSVILVYSNGNIDIFKDNNFTNIPEFKLKTVAGSKNVNDIYAEDGRAFVSTSLGVLVIDMENSAIAATYQFYNGNQSLPISSFIGTGSYYYTATPAGLYRAPKNSPQLQNFQIWKKIDSTHRFNSIRAFNNKLYLADDSALYVLQNDTAKKIFGSGIYQIMSVNPAKTSLFIASYYMFSTRVFEVDSTGTVLDSMYLPDQTHDVVKLDDGSVWLGNDYAGLARVMDTAYRVSLNYYNPYGPADVVAVDVYAHNNELYLAHGGYNDLYRGLGNKSGFSKRVDGKWSLYRSGTVYPYGAFGDTLRDFVTIAKDETDGTLYAGSFSSGLFELRADGAHQLYKQGSMLDHSISNGPNDFPVVGVEFDPDHNLWVGMFGSDHELNVKEKASGNWYKYHLPYNNSAGAMVFDDEKNTWYVSTNGGGVIGFNTNGTLSDASDDRSVHLGTGKNNGNLPHVNVICIAHDKNDNLWIGTADGIAILYNAASRLNGQNSDFDAEIPIVQYDRFAGYLFAGQVVNTIAVDGANRKWVGTNSGVWLLSPDAGNSKIIRKFTSDDSPLPSNRIRKIAVDDVTGEVYIATDAGLVSFRGDATEGAEAGATVVTFPNPVPSNYKGTIAIKGLATNSDVRITDMSGQLVYRTTANGGMATWNGLDYKGRRPQSGVYLIFATNSDGTQTYSGKMVFMQ